MTRAERIAAIRERAEKATAGPWKLDGDPPWQIESVDGHAIAQSQQFATLREGGNEKRTLNAAFIANARADVPWLLEELAAAERVIHEARRFARYAGHDTILSPLDRALLAYDKRGGE